MRIENKMEIMIDKICSNPMEKYFERRDKMFENLNRQLDYFKFKCDLDDAIIKLSKRFD